MTLRTYKLELRHPNTEEKVDFGPRKVGDVGRDILIVKRALGSVVSYQSLIDSREEELSIDDPEFAQEGRKLAIVRFPEA